MGSWLEYSVKVDVWRVSQTNAVKDTELNLKIKSCYARYLVVQMNRVSV